MSSAEILSNTLNSITATKLAQVTKQRAMFEDGKAALLAKVDQQASQLDRVEVLLTEIEELAFMDKTEKSYSKVNVLKFLEQARGDPSVSLKLQIEWESKLIAELDAQSRRFEYASLYGKLVEDWIENDSSKKPMVTENGESFEQVGRKEMYDQRVVWEEYVFKALETDTTAIKAYLDALFKSEKPTSKALTDLRLETFQFEKGLQKDGFNEDTLVWCINGLLASDLLTDAKATILRDFSRNKTVLVELADVLNMRLAALESWSWDKAGTYVEQRRHLNGRYRFYHDEDLLQSIFLRYIGVKWSVFFKARFRTFANNDNVWKSSSTVTSSEDRERREVFVGSDDIDRISSVERSRKNIWREDVFMEQLQDTVEENAKMYDDSNSETDTDTGRKTPQQIVQTVLHLLVTDIIMKTRLGEDITVVRSDFKWFGPSMPHSTMFTVLDYFGVSDKWLNFFKKALEAPMIFTADGPGAPVRTRKRGTPVSGPLSDVLGETVLFCLDFAMNQNMEGSQLFRLHDDIWFWGKDEVCKKGWATMEKFAKLMGLEFSEEKTGSVCIPKNRSRLTESVAPAKSSDKKIVLTKPVKGLPHGAVRWGFLKLESTGRFEIDQVMLDEHIAELRTQLAACKSVFDWIQAWNIYSVRFFSTNFGQPAQCNGRSHVNMMLQAFQRIQAGLFEDQSGFESVSDHIRHTLFSKFGIKDVPEGYLYFPMSSGGLDIKNPFIPLYAIRSNLATSPDKFMDDFFEREEVEYNRLKKRFDTGLVHKSSAYKRYQAKSHGKIDFMSFEEYTRYRERTSSELSDAFSRLMGEPSEHSVVQSPDVKAAIASSSAWVKMKPYDRWVVQLYASEMIDRFGGLQVVERSLLPTGMVAMTRQSRFQWAG